MIPVIEILKATAVSSHPSGPHYILAADHHALEDADGNTRIALDREALLAWLAQDPSDKLRIEAVALIANNAGVTFLNGRWVGGERRPALLFHAVASQERSGDGKLFYDLRPHHAARIFGHARDFPGMPGSYATIEQHLVELLALHGIEPNMERIKAEFCPTCGARA